MLSPATGAAVACTHVLCRIIVNGNNGQPEASPGESLHTTPDASKAARPMPHTTTAYKTHTTS